MLKITNNRIITFYESNPTLDFNTINLFMIDMLQNMLTANKDVLTHGEIHNKMTAQMQQSIIPNLDIRSNSNTIKSTKTVPIHIILTKLYSSGEINILDNDGTFSLKRIRKQNIILKSMHSDENISIEDQELFTQLISEKNCSGILISQNSGISTKKDFQIEIVNNNIIVYIHNSNYSETQIDTAVSIIDNLYAKLRQFTIFANDTDITISKDVLEIINTEYQLFITQKIAIVELLKENQKKIITQMEEFRFPGLDKFLATKFAAPVQKPGLKCELCKGFTAHNLKALAAHKRGCIRKQGKPIVSTNSVQHIPLANITNTTIQVRTADTHEHSLVL